MTPWHTQTTNQATTSLDVDIASGLTSEQAGKRLLECGPNDLVQIGQRSVSRILWEQVRGAMALLLVVAAAVSAVLHEYTDAVVIMAIVLINAALGFFQDYRAEKALAALKKLSVPIVRVRRDAILKEISARQLVPGDVILLEVGNHVPADCRLFDSVNLQIQESALTGESDAIEKQTEAIAGESLPLGDRTNMAHMGTTVTYGHGQGIVIATGMDTELGHIARSLQTVIPRPTPLQDRLAQLGRGLAVIAMGIVALVFAMGMVRGEDPQLMLMTSLSLAVAAVPEGLPAVATVALALGARRMFKRHALIRKLAAVETLGSVTVICSDKTGTLTENRMTVTVLDVAENQLPLDTESIADLPRVMDVTNDTALALLLAGAGLCNDAELDTQESSQEIHAIGDPTEVALAIVASQLGFPKQLLAKQFPRTAEVPFDSDRKRMTTIHQIQSGQCQVDSVTVGTVHDAIVALGNEHIAFTKGAVDSVLEVCTSLWVRGQARPMDDDWKRRILAGNEALAGDGMRVLGIAFGPLQSLPASVDATTIEQQLIFVGMLGMIDPPRTEVADAVARCRSAGIRTIMITGDHPLTATHIAAELSIANDGKVMTGQEIDTILEDDLSKTVKQVSVYARVAPKHKLQLVRALQRNGDVVAMTGDGVNDAPALKQAHIGVAMGIAGTDVSKEAAQMVLLDDNFATIVGAVEEGRIVYDNIRKFVKYTMTSNSGEIWVMVLGPLMGMPLPLLPLQILWVNLVTDGLPGLALAVEQGERDTMSRPPYPPEDHIFGRGMGIDIAWIGLLMGAVSLSMGYWYWSIGTTSDSHWRTMVFTVLTFSQMGNAMAIRSSRESLFQIGVFSNRTMIGSVAVTVALQIAVIYWLPLQQIFKTTALSVGELATCIVFSAIVFWAVELKKLIIRLSGRRVNLAENFKKAPNA